MQSPILIRWLSTILTLPDCRIFISIRFPTMSIKIDLNQFQIYHLETLSFSFFKNFLISFSFGIQETNYMQKNISFAEKKEYRLGSVKISELLDSTCKTQYDQGVMKLKQSDNCNRHNLTVLLYFTLSIFIVSICGDLGKVSVENETWEESSSRCLLGRYNVRAALCVIIGQRTQWNERTGSPVLCPSVCTIARRHRRGGSYSLRNRAIFFPAHSSFVTFTHCFNPFVTDSIFLPFNYLLQIINFNVKQRISALKQISMYHWWFILDIYLLIILWHFFATEALCNFFSAINLWLAIDEMLIREVFKKYFEYK